MIRDLTYFDEWQSLNSKMKENGFTWGSLAEKGEENQYLLRELHQMDSQTYRRIEQATRDIGRVFQKMAGFLGNTPFLYQHLLLPENTWRTVRLPSRIFSYFSRMDLIVNGDNVRIIEINCDTPTGFLEGSVGNRVACEHYGVANHNNLEAAVKRAFSLLDEEYGIDDEMVYFTSYGWHEEDRQTTEFLRKHSPFRNTCYVPLNDIRVNQQGVFTSTGDPIKVLYRLYPLEYVSSDKGPNGEPIGEWMLQHVAEGRLTLINPPSAFLCQAKTTMAAIWGLHEEQHPLFTQEEHDIIERYFLPTYLDPEPFVNTAYVEKPIWGREGGGVSIVDASGQVSAQDKTPYYYEQPKIYQKYTPMPKVRVQTWEGEYEGCLLIGSFLVGGEPSGMFLRVGGKITGNLSMFLPVTVQ